MAVSPSRGGVVAASRAIENTASCRTSLNIFGTTSTPAPISMARNRTKTTTTLSRRRFHRRVISFTSVLAMYASTNVRKMTGKRCRRRISVARKASQIIHFCTLRVQMFCIADIVKLFGLSPYAIHTMDGAS
jgi:hypothetical protein